MLKCIYYGNMGMGACPSSPGLCSGLVNSRRFFFTLGNNTRLINELITPLSVVICPYWKAAM